MTKTMKGGCLCGAVTYEAQGEPMIVGHCHCVDCRKTSGTGHCTHVMMREDAVRVEGALSCYESLSDSANVVKRFFCPVCGAAIHSTNAAMPGLTALRASSLDDPDAIAPQLIVYKSRAPKWDVMDASLPAFAEMPEGGPASVMKD